LSKVLELISGASDFVFLFEVILYFGKESLVGRERVVSLSVYERGDVLFLP